MNRYVLQVSVASREFEVEMDAYSNKMARVNARLLLRHELDLGANQGIRVKSCHRIDPEPMDAFVTEIGGEGLWFESDYLSLGEIGFIQWQ